MCLGAVGPEPVAHVQRSQCGEVPQGLQTQILQQDGQRGLLQGVETDAGQELRRGAGLDDAYPVGAPGGLFCGENAIRDADSSGCCGEGFHTAQKHLGRVVLTAEIAGRPFGAYRAAAGIEQLHTGHDLLHRGDDGLERPFVHHWVVGEDLQRRASGLGFAQSQAGLHTGAAGGCGASENLSLMDQGNRTGGLGTVFVDRGGSRPVRKLEHHGPGRVNHAFTAVCNSSCSGAAG